MPAWCQGPGASVEVEPSVEVEVEVEVDVVAVIMRAEHASSSTRISPRQIAVIWDCFAPTRVRVDVTGT